MADAIITMKDVNKWYGKFHVLRHVNLEVARGERIVICGPSGSGKSTLIRCINRLEEHQQGQIVVEGTEITSDLKDVEAIRRDVGTLSGFVFLIKRTNIRVSCRADSSNG